MEEDGRAGPGGVQQARIYAQRQRERFRFDASKIEAADNTYVAWIDLMGAGHMMSVSMEKSANSLVRLHMAVDQAVSAASEAVEVLPINDGVFIIAPSQTTVKRLVRAVMTDLACLFISTPDAQNKFLVRGAIAYGPVYRGDAIAAGLSLAKRQRHEKTLSRVAFGPAIIQAYQAEASAPPYGISVHESARSFAPEGAKPFRMTHWLWWTVHEGMPQPDGVAPLSDIKEALGADLLEHMEWIRSTLLFHGLKLEKVRDWEQAIRQYLRLKGALHGG